MFGTENWMGFGQDVLSLCCRSEWSAGVGGRESGVGFDIPNPEPRTPNPEAEQGGVAGPGPKPMSPLLLPA